MVLQRNEGIEIALEEPVLNHAVFFKFTRSVLLGDFGTDASGVLQHLPFIRREEDVEPLRPILHRHGHAAFGAAFRQIEVGVHDAPQIFQFRR